MTRMFIALILLLLYHGEIIAQNNPLTIKGLIKTFDNKSAEHATVALYFTHDSVVFKQTAADKNGAFRFNELKPGRYFIRVSLAGFRKNQSPAFNITDSTSSWTTDPVVLRPLNEELAVVTVTSKRPLIEQKADRTIVNVEASITNTGATALEVLEKSPGILVDRDGNISLKGKQGVQILLDGRPTQLSGEDLANLLRNMPASQMDQVEIMTNPPARYDAAGSAGIINIKTKKLITAGYNGSASASFSQGRYPKVNESFNFNYRNSRLNVFSNLSHGYRKGFGQMTMQRRVIAGSGQSYFDQVTDRIATSNGFNGRAGIDYFPDKKTNIGLQFSAGTNQSDNSSQTRLQIADASKSPQSITRAVNVQGSESSSLNANLNFRRVLHKNGRELTADIDLVRYTTGNSQVLINSYFDPSEMPTGKGDTLNGDLPQDMKVLGARIDYYHPLAKGAKFEAGIKTGIVRTDNDARYDSLQQGVIVHDYNRSNHFIYSENINAAYLNFSTASSKKWSAQLGLRLENTISKGEQITTGETFDRNYTKLFPTAYVQYKMNTTNTWRANYGRRIRRPNYNSLNPFIRFIDRYTYSQGNPFLKAAIGNSFEVSHNWRDKLNTSVNYSYVSDLINDVIEQRGAEVYRRPSNISSLRQYTLSVNSNNSITPWWTSNINLDLYNSRYKGSVSGSGVEVSATTLSFNATEQFKFSKMLSGEINGMFRSGAADGFTKTKPMGAIGAGMGLQVLKGKGTLRASIRDIFLMQRRQTTGRYANVDLDILERNETRVVSMGFTYRFSKGKKVAPVKRTAGSASEEQDRIGQ